MEGYQMQKYISRLTCLVAFGVALTGPLVSSIRPAEAQALDKIVSQKHIKIGWVPYAKLVYRDLETQKVKGAMVDILEAITKQMNIPSENIEYVETDWGNFGVGLASGKFDLSIAATFKTVARASAVSFTEPLFYLGNSALVRKDDDRFKNVKSVYDLDQPGVTIAVISGEQSDDFARRNFTKATIKSIKAADIGAAMLEVVSKRADVGLADAGNVAKFANSQPGTVDLFKSNPWNVQAIAWAVSPNDARLLTFINTAIDVLQSNGSLRQILNNPEYAETPIMVLSSSPQLIER
jgi:ABC-type amino acid transport substrate-binding protein